MATEREDRWKTVFNRAVLAEPLTLNEWMNACPEGDESALFEDSLAARYPLIDRECPFDD